MAVSTTQVFTLDGRKIIELAYDRAGGEQLTGWDVRQSVQCFNLLLQELTMRNVNLWQIAQMTQACTTDTITYQLPAYVVDVVDMTVHDTTASPVTDLPVSRISRDAYAMLADKESSGTPFNYWLDRQRDQPTVYLYQPPDSDDWELSIWYIRKMYDQLNGQDNADVPSRWLPALISGLAYYMGRQRRLKLGIQFVGELEREWEKDYGIAITEDADSSPMRLRPDLSAYFH